MDKIEISNNNFKFDEFDDISKYNKYIDNIGKIVTKDMN